MPETTAPSPTHNTILPLPPGSSSESTNAIPCAKDAGSKDPSPDTPADLDLSSFDLAPLHSPDFTNLPASYVALQAFPRKIEEFAAYLLSDWEGSVCSEFDTSSTLAALEEDSHLQKLPEVPTVTGRVQRDTLPMIATGVDTAEVRYQKRQREDEPTPADLLQHPSRRTPPSILPSTAPRDRKGKQRADLCSQPQRKRLRRREPPVDQCSGRRLASASSPAQRNGTRESSLGCNSVFWDSAFSLLDVDSVARLEPDLNASVPAISKSKIKRQATTDRAFSGDLSDLLSPDMPTVGPSCTSRQSLRARLPRISMPTLADFELETARERHDTKRLGSASATNDTTRSSRGKDQSSTTEDSRSEASGSSSATYNNRPQDSAAPYYTCPIEGCYVTFPSQRSRIIHLINSLTGHGWKRCPLCRTVMEPDVFRLHRCKFNAKTRIWSPCFRRSNTP